MTFKIKDENHDMFGMQKKCYTGIQAIMAIASLASAGAAVYSATKKPNIPKIPQIDTTVGIVNQTDGKTVKDQEVDTINKRKVARKGTTSLRIPLQAKQTGLTSSGGSGLNI